MGEPLILQMAGDLILDEPNPDALFDLARHQLQACDVLVGHVEVPHTARGVETHFDVPAPASDPAHLAALQRAGFHVATLAGNHIADAGPNGVEDTIAELRPLVTNAIPVLRRNIDHTAGQHAAIVDAILAGDAELARRAGRPVQRLSSGKDCVWDFSATTVWDRASPGPEEIELVARMYTS